MEMKVPFASVYIFIAICHPFFLHFALKLTISRAIMSSIREEIGLGDADQLRGMAELFHAHQLVIKTPKGFEKIPISPQMVERDEEGKACGIKFMGEIFPMDQVVPDTRVRVAAVRGVMSITGTEASHRLRERALEVEKEIRDRTHAGGNTRVVMAFPERKKLSDV
jgi:hypothetical protein